MRTHTDLGFIRQVLDDAEATTAYAPTTPYPQRPPLPLLRMAGRP